MERYTFNEDLGIVTVTAPATLVAIVGSVFCVTIIWSQGSWRVTLLLCLYVVFAGFVFFFRQ
jgi:hypothetical protein